MSGFLYCSVRLKSDLQNEHIVFDFRRFEFIRTRCWQSNRSYRILYRLAIRYVGVLYRIVGLKADLHEQVYFTRIPGFAPS